MRGRRDLLIAATVETAIDNTGLLHAELDLATLPIEQRALAINAAIKHAYDLDRLVRQRRGVK